MSQNIDSFFTLIQRIKAVNGLPQVLEALWDGDSNGWYLVLNLYYKRRTWWFKEIIQPYFSKARLGIISCGGDIRLFSDTVPPWPEATLAKELGQLAKDKYDLEFYFPSEEPDDDCPAWDQQHLAIACADCSKLIIPTDSPYLPKDICYNCHLNRSSTADCGEAAPITHHLFGTGHYKYKEESYAQAQARYSGFSEDLFSRLEGNFPGFISNLRFFQSQDYQLEDMWAIYEDAAIQFGIQLDPDTPVIVLWNANPENHIEIGDWSEDASGDAIRFIEEEFFAKGPSQSLPPAWWY